MLSLRFWKYWSKSYQVLFWLLSVGLLITLLLFWKGYFASPAPVITYENFQQIQSIESTSHSFSVGLFNISIPADSYLVFEYIFASHLQPNILAAYFFLATLIIGFVFFISITTVLSRFRFLISMGITILFLASLQIDGLQVFGLPDKLMTILCILIFGGTAFYLHAFRSYISFSQRLIIFSLLTLVTGVICCFFSKVTAPLLFIASNGFLAGIALTVIFILMVSHEIVAVFVSIITKSVKSGKSLRHFLVLTSVYLFNLFLMFASKMGIIEWSFFSVSPFFLLTISAVLGVWGFRNREAIHENILNEEPLRIYFFVSVALIAMGALTYFASSSSDMMMDALEDLIVAAHFGGGLIFVLYVVANFAPMLVQNLPVHKVLYKPETMPYFTFRLMAVIATFAAISWATSWKTYLNQMAGTFYLVKGDISLAGKDDALAESYYQRSLLFRNQNQHAHYGLATIHARRSDSSKERQEYEKAIEWTPSPALYLNLAGIFSRQGDLLEAALTLDEGKKKFPSSGELQNAAGLSFLRLKQKDSAFYFLMRAAESGGASKAALTNMAAASAQFNAVDTSFSTFSWESGQTVNELAQANLSGQKIMAIDLYPNDTSLNVYTSMNLCNYLLNQRANADTILARKALALSRKEVNEPFSEQLMIASAHAMYARGLVSEALKTVREIAFSGNSDYFSLIGLWLLEQDNAAVASSYLKAVAEKSQPRALYYQAIAETEADSLAKATISWDSLAKSRDKNIAAFAGKMKKVLSAKPGQTNALSNDEKYLYCRYKIQLNDRTSFLKVADEIGDEHLRVQAIIDRCKKWMTIDEVNEAKNLLSLVDKVYTKNLNDQIVNLKMRLAVEDENWQFIQRTLTSAELPFNLRIYYEAILAVQSGDQAAAQQKFGYLAQANYQFEDGLIAAIRYFSAGSFDQLKNFSTLVEGLSAKPNSVKYLKQHVLMATTLGFENEAQNSLNRLRKLMPEASFKKFVTANSDFIGVRQ